MTNISEITRDLKDNNDVNYWGNLLDDYDKRLAELHIKIDATKYTEWGLVALKAIQGNKEAKTLSYQWELLREVDRKLESDGGDFEPRPETVWHQRGDSSLDSVEFPAPAPGEYRLFVLVVDSHDGAATANLPVLVETATT